MHDISISIETDAITAVIGPNGSGKSTLLKTIAGIVKPRRGAIMFEGDRIAGLRPDRILRKGIAMVPQGRKVFPDMTVLENLEMGGYTIGDRHILHDRFEAVFKIFPVLEERRKQLSKTLSGGEQMQLVLGRALVAGPKMLLLDEPSLGLSPKLIDVVYERVKEIRDSGIPILLVEQNVRKALGVSDYVYVLDLGTVRFQGKSGTLLADEQVVRRYIGIEGV